jgi:NADPH:quinone reductase-like Zn-dependent oxidoreductase
VLALGTGGVSVFALQLAKAAGARVFITSSSDEKLARARALGADGTVNYREVPEWGKAVRALTGGRGVDHVVEVGGADTLEQSLRATAAGGRITVVGVLSGAKTSISVTSIFMNYLRLQGILVGHRASFEALCDFVGRHALRPVVSDVFPFERARDGFELMARGGHFGKICLRIE